VVMRAAPTRYNAPLGYPRTPAQGVVGRCVWVLHASRNRGTRDENCVSSVGRALPRGVQVPVIGNAFEGK
jgi:hypothetical protein